MLILKQFGAIIAIALTSVAIIIVAVWLFAEVKTTIKNIIKELKK
ncbi:hypothetical protein LCGC14_2874700 [marine sediment metagenome]|uniref:Uncharacterized protein n=1 Tax=marine sediment metagenome TaxID=412755 RepID=A0A0F8Y1V0_9ZZZZ